MCVCVSELNPCTLTFLQLNFGKSPDQSSGVSENFGLFASQTSLGFYMGHVHTPSASIVMLIQVVDGSNQAVVIVVTPHW